MWPVTLVVVSTLSFFVHDTVTMSWRKTRCGFFVVSIRCQLSSCREVKKSILERNIINTYLISHSRIVLWRLIVFRFETLWNVIISWIRLFASTLWSEQDHALGYDRCWVSLLAIISLPWSSFKTSLDVHFLSLGKIFLCKLCKMCPCCNTVKLWLLLLISRIILPLDGCCNGERCNFLSWWSLFDFWICCEVSENKDFIDWAHNYNITDFLIRLFVAGGSITFLSNIASLMILDVSDGIYRHDCFFWSHVHDMIWM